jgi:hypothetical protein
LRTAWSPITSAGRCGADVVRDGPGVRHSGNSVSVRDNILAATSVEKNARLWLD